MAIVLYCTVAEENHVFGKQQCNVGGISVHAHRSHSICSISVGFDQTGGAILPCTDIIYYTSLSLPKATEEFL